MERHHARYPFLESARDAVEAADVDIAELVAGGEGVVLSRARDRVESALSTGHAGDGEPAGMARSTRVELLSYPVARILVSLLEEPLAVDAYARAEAATARARLERDLPPPGGRSTAGDGNADGLSVRELLGEFGLAGRVDGRDPFRVDVTTYLQLSRGLKDDRWALVRRSLSDGAVPVERGELYDLLEQAVADRVAEGLPLGVPQGIADAVAEPAAEIEAMLADDQIPTAFDTVDPGRFPPCMDALLERARDGETLPEHSEYALVGFLAASGMDADAVVDLAGGGLDRATVEHQLAHLRDERGLEYAPPSCATMDAAGDCVNRDERCDTIAHPLSYYESALEDAE